MNSLIIFLAKDLIFIVLIGAFIYWLTLVKRQKVETAISGSITVVIAYVLAKIGSSLFYDARPFVSDHVHALFKYTADNGFPSDHTLLAASVAVTLFFISKKWGIGFFVLAIVVGWARVAAGVHHPIDIIGSLVFAGIGGVIAYYLAPYLTQALAKTRYAKWLGFNETSPKNMVGKK